MESLSLIIREFYLQNRKWTKIVLIVFGLGLLLGATAAIQYPQLMADVIASFEDKFGQDPALDIQLARAIFMQNAFVSLAAWLGGLALGIIPVLIVFVNGFLLGYVVTFLLASNPDVLSNLIFAAAGLLPHGLFELPAFLISAILGLKLGFGWLSKDAAGKRLEVLKDSLAYTFGWFFYVVLALVIAAAIEVFITGNLINSL